MQLLLIVMVGVLYSSGIYMMFRRSMVKLLFGLLLLGNGANLLIFLMGDLTKGRPPIIGEQMTSLEGAYADPVPQALILTAIVISFGLQSFAIVLLKIVYKNTGTDDLDTLNVQDIDI
ncbi:MAG: Na+/H+ antiporter subunit C [Taibaiella sp.]|nr:Na+/H+ antiporter subunit C [Taibaiella sp.]